MFLTYIFVHIESFYVFKGYFTFLVKLNQFLISTQWSSTYKSLFIFVDQREYLKAIEAYDTCRQTEHEVTFGTRLKVIDSLFNVFGCPFTHTRIIVMNNKAHICVSLLFKFFYLCYLLKMKLM